MLYSLESLNLKGNYFESLPSSVGQLSKLEILDVTHCLGLKSLPMLPSSLHSLEASYCYELERLPNLSNLKHLTMLHLSWCEKLIEFEGLEVLISAESIKLDNCVKLESFVENKIFQDISKDIGNCNVCDIIFDGYEVPNWFVFQRELWSDSLSWQVPHQLPNMEIQGLIICFACKELADHCVDTGDSSWYISAGKVVVDNKSKNFTWSRTLDIPLTVNKTTTWVIKIPNCVPPFTQPSLFKHLTKEKQALVEFSSTGKIFPNSFVEYDDTIQVSFSFLDTDRCRYPSVKKIGVHFFYASSSQHENVSQENFQASPENSQASQSIKCCGFFQ
ncbi:disease resistance protein Roq1-like [Macadamia integrifolia]|uniref:disease resistance protein Roq1-like n=1 Tax=Macadamia integrifolia TaxID=60698 RepID=UPI001C4E64C3|nr:disease resistance protein Roq1-like [Macadamia integrifolia]